MIKETVMKEYYLIGLAFGLGLGTARVCYAVFAALCERLAKELEKAETDVEHVDQNQRTIQNDENRNGRVRIKGFCDN